MRFLVVFFEVFARKKGICFDGKGVACIDFCALFDILGAETDDYSAVFGVFREYDGESLRQQFSTFPREEPVACHG